MFLVLLLWNCMFLSENHNSTTCIVGSMNVPARIRNDNGNIEPYFLFLEQSLKTRFGQEKQIFIKIVNSFSFNKIFLLYFLFNI